MVQGRTNIGQLVSQLSPSEKYGSGRTMETSRVLLACSNLRRLLTTMISLSVSRDTSCAIRFFSEPVPQQTETIDIPLCKVSNLIVCRHTSLPLPVINDYMYMYTCTCCILLGNIQFNWYHETVYISTVHVQCTSCGLVICLWSAVTVHVSYM